MALTLRKPGDSYPEWYHLGDVVAWMYRIDVKPDDDEVRKAEIARHNAEVDKRADVLRSHGVALRLRVLSYQQREQMRADLNAEGSVKSDVYRSMAVQGIAGVAGIVDSDGAAMLWTDLTAGDIVDAFGAIGLLPEIATMVLTVNSLSVDEQPPFFTAALASQRI